MATYKYMGLNVTVPTGQGYVYIAMDMNFFVYAFKEQPTFNEDTSEWDIIGDPAEVLFLGTLHELSSVPISALQIVIGL